MDWFTSQKEELCHCPDSGVWGEGKGVGTGWKEALGRRDQRGAVGPLRDRPSETGRRWVLSSCHYWWVLLFLVLFLGKRTRWSRILPIRLKSLSKNKFQIVSIPSLSHSEMKGVKGLADPSIGTGLLPQNEKLRGWLSWTRRRWFWTHIITTIFRRFAVCTLKVVNLLFYCFIVFHLVSIVLVPPNRQFKWLLVPKSVVSPCAAHGEVIVAHRRRPRPPGAPGHFGQRLEPAPCTLASSIKLP